MTPSERRMYRLGATACYEDLTITQGRKKYHVDSRDAQFSEGYNDAVKEQLLNEAQRIADDQNYLSEVMRARRTRA